MQKQEGIEDLRVRRTRKLLQQAFIELTVEKGFASLTVSDITERAMVNRSTFYRHYVDKYDLLEQFMDEMYALLDDGEGKGRMADSQEALSGLIELLKHVQRFADFYRVMLGVKGDLLFAQRFQQKTEKSLRVMLSVKGDLLFVQRFQKEMEKSPLFCFNQAFPEQVCEPGTPPIDLRFNIITSAVCGAVSWWLEQGQSWTPEQFAQWLAQFIYDIAVSSLKLKE